MTIEHTINDIKITHENKGNNLRAFGRNTTDGLTRVAITDGGFGALGFMLEVDEAKALAQYLQGSTGDVPTTEPTDDAEAAEFVELSEDQERRSIALAGASDAIVRDGWPPVLSELLAAADWIITGQAPQA